MNSTPLASPLASPTPVYNNGFAAPLRRLPVVPTTTGLPLNDARPLPSARPVGVPSDTPLTTWSPLPSPAPKGAPVDDNHDNILEILGAIIPTIGSAFGNAGGGSAGGFTGTGAVPVDMGDTAAVGTDTQPASDVASASPSPLLWLGLLVAVVGAYFGYKAYKKGRA